MPPSRPISSFFMRFLRGWDRGFRAVLRFLNRSTRGLVVWLGAWGRSRNWRYFFLGLPAFLMVVAVLAVATLRLSANSQDLENQYVKKAQTDFDEKNYQAALVSYERLANMENKKPEVLFKMAQTYEEMAGTGKPEYFDRCLKIMNQLAQPDQDGGYGPAHEWQAKFLILTQFKDKNARDQILAHCRRALKSPNVQSRDLAIYHIAWVLSENEKYHDAELELAGIVDRKREAYLLYSQVLAKQDKTEPAKAAARKAAEYFKENLDRLPKNNLSLTRFYANALIAAERFPDAVEALNKISDNKTLAIAYNAWQDSLAKNSPDKVVERLDLIQKGLQNDVGNIGLLNAMLSILGDTPEKAAKAHEAIPKALATGPNTAPAHLLLGMDYLRNNDDYELAIFHLNAACDLDRNFGVAINNLAALLAEPKNKNAEPDPKDLERALELMNFVVNGSPNNLIFHDTRGRIYLKMKEYDLARIDLEQVLRNEKLVPDVHKSLAEAYEGLRDPRMAQVHRDRQADLDKQQKKK